MALCNLTDDLKIGLCATMSPGLMQKYNQGRLDIQLYQNPDDGDEVCLWNVSWFEPTDMAAGEDFTEFNARKASRDISWSSW